MRMCAGEGWIAEAYDAGLLQGTDLKLLLQVERFVDLPVLLADPRLPDARHWAATRCTYM